MWLLLEEQSTEGHNLASHSRSRWSVDSGTISLEVRPAEHSEAFWFSFFFVILTLRFWDIQDNWGTPNTLRFTFHAGPSMQGVGQHILRTAETVITTREVGGVRLLDVEDREKNQSLAIAVTSLTAREDIACHYWLARRQCSARLCSAQFNPVNRVRFI